MDTERTTEKQSTAAAATSSENESLVTDPSDDFIHLLATADGLVHIYDGSEIDTTSSNNQWINGYIERCHHPTINLLLMIN